MRTHRRALGGLAIAVLLGIVAACGTGRSDRTGSAGTAVPGRAAPDFSAHVVSRAGGVFSLRGERGHAVLMSFLNTQAEASRGSNPSRSEIVFLKSMNAQNHPHGLRTVIIDAAAAAGVPAPSHDELVNFTFDWALDPSIVVIGDTNGSLERAFGITTVPTTLVIDRRGIVRHRWNGVALAAQLDFAIRPLVGRALVGSGPAH